MPQDLPTVAGELRALRDAAGIGQPKLADTLGISQSRLSRIELGQGRASAELVEAWLETCLPAAQARAANDDLPVRVHRAIAIVLTRAEQPGYGAFLLRLLEDEHTEALSVYELRREGLQHRQRQLYAEHRTAARLRMLEPVHVPGPLQTVDYARRLFLLDQEHAAISTDQIEQALAHRIEYGQLLLSGAGPQLHAVVTENSLDMLPFGAGDLRPGQVERLAVMAASPNVTVQILPRSIAVPCMVLAGFVLVESPTGQVKALVETYSAQLAFTGERDIAEYEYRWRVFTAAALDPEQSKAWLAQQARTS